MSRDARLPGAPVALTLADLEEALTVLVRVHRTIEGLQARCLTIAEVENANHVIRALEARLARHEAERERLTRDLQEAERRSRLYRRRSIDAETKLASLQRVISQHLAEYLSEPSLSRLPSLDRLDAQDRLPLF